MRFYLRLFTLVSLSLLSFTQTNAQCDDCITEPLEPVCVLDDNGVVITMLNACFAECLGFNEFVDCEDNSSVCNCFEIFDPVCVTLDNGEIITFPNSCFAECEGYSEADYSSCDYKLSFKIHLKFVPVFELKLV